MTNVMHGDEIRNVITESEVVNAAVEVVMTVTNRKKLIDNHHREHVMKIHHHETETEDVNDRIEIEDRHDGRSTEVFTPNPMIDLLKLCVFCSTVIARAAENVLNGDVVRKVVNRVASHATRRNRTKRTRTTANNDKIVINNDHIHIHTQSHCNTYTYR